MLGVDLVHIPEFQRQLDKGGETFMKKAFRSTELKDRNTEHLAGLWAAKEAIIKASGLSTEHWTDIAIDYDANGAPYGTFKSGRFSVSIAHHGEYAVAVALKQ